MKKTPENPQDSLRKRYLYKVFASIFALISNLVIYSIVPRALGPASYGNFNFLSHFFSQLVEILDGRSSVGALVKTSQRPDEKGLVVSYFYYAAFVSILLFSAIALVDFVDGNGTLWPEQELSNVYLAAIWGLLIWYHGVLHKLCDAYGYTVMAEKVRIIQKVIAISLLLGFYFFDYITLKSFFLYYISTLLILIFGFAFVLIRYHKLPLKADFKKLSFSKTKDYIKEYYIYTFPLLLYISLEAVTSIFDRWLLQYSSGSEEQGFFSLGFQISAISALFVTSISSLVEREFSIAHGNKDHLQLRYLFARYIPLLFSFTAFFSCFTFFHAENIISVFAGNKYQESLLVIVIMSVFPIFFTFGRILGSIYFATGQNIMYRNFGFIYFFGGMILSYFLVAPTEYGGWQLGAIGLAVKIVVVYGALVVSQFYFICKVLGIKPWAYWIQQIVVVALFLFFSYLSFEALSLFPDLNIFAKLLLGGLFYNFLIVLIVATFPRVFGLTQTDINDVFEKIWFFSGQKVKKGDLNLPTLIVDEHSKKKIMLLSARSSIHTIRWVNGLAERGHEVILVSMHGGLDLLHENVKYHHLPWRAPLGYFLNVPYFKKLLAQENPDLLHIHFVSGYGTMGTLSGFQPRVVSVWGTDIFNFPYLSQVNKALIYFNLKTARWICSTSWVMAQQTANISKDVINKMTVTPFGVNIDVFKRTKINETAKVTIGTIKTLMEKYGIDTLIKGFALAREELIKLDPNWEKNLELVICGKGPQEPMLKEMVENLGISEITQFKGFVPHSEIQDELNAMDIYVAMSREESESFGVAIIEASACEIPVVVSNFGGLPEVVDDGKTGFVVKENTAEALSEKLIKLVLDKKLRQTMGTNGRIRVIEKYSWLENLKLMEDVYSHILRRKS